MDTPELVEPAGADICFIKLAMLFLEGCVGLAVEKPGEPDGTKENGLLIFGWLLVFVEFLWFSSVFCSFFGFSNFTEFVLF